MPRAARRTSASSATTRAATAQSGVTPGPYTIEQLGRDVVALLDHLGTARASFCGLSLGGMTGMWLGIHAPARIDKLVLANTAARIAPRRSVEPAHRQGERRRHRRDFRCRARALVHAGSSAQREPAALARMKAMMERQPPGGLRRVLRRRARHGPARGRGTHRRADARDHRHARRVHPARRRPRSWRSGSPARASSSFAAAHLSNIEAAAAFNAALASFLHGEAT